MEHYGTLRYSKLGTEIIDNLPNMRLKYAASQMMGIFYNGLYPLFVNFCETEASYKIMDAIWSINPQEEIQIYKNLKITSDDGNSTSMSVKLPQILPDHMEKIDCCDHYKIKCTQSTRVGHSKRQRTNSCGVDKINIVKQKKKPEIDLSSKLGNEVETIEHHSEVNLPHLSQSSESETNKFVNDDIEVNELQQSNKSSQSHHERMTVEDLEVNLPNMTQSSVIGSELTHKYMIDDRNVYMKYDIKDDQKIQHKHLDIDEQLNDNSNIECDIDIKEEFNTDEIIKYKK